MNKYCFIPFLLVLFLFTSRTTCWSQQDSIFFDIDRHARKTPENVASNIKKLTEYLIRPCKTELEKARSLYTWLTYNIDYDREAYRRGNKRINRNNKDIMQRRRAVCFGYSTLYKEMCEKAGLKCEVISGYSKGTLTATPNLESPDHAWNSVQIDSAWFLLDATWGSSIINAENDFVRTFKEGYFLTSPEKFIVNHLPQDPIWQLLPCPIKPKDFKKTAERIQALAESSAQCYNFQDSIAYLLKLSSWEKNLRTAKNAYRYNPTLSMRKELMAQHFDYAGYLSDVADTLQRNQQYEAMTRLQERIVLLAQTAEQLHPLFDWQKALYGSTLVNLAVSKSRVEKETLKQWTKEEKTFHYTDILELLEKAKEVISTHSQKNMFFNMLDHCEEQIEATKENIQLVSKLR